MPISLIEHELWNIFTYYTLHSDPTQPELLKVANFLRFAKDAQIISKNLSHADLQIELTKEVRNKRNNGNGDRTTGYISFLDFLGLLQKLAIKIYPECSNNEDALRRLLLENVLLLAGRRFPTSINQDAANDDALKVLKDQFGRTLLNIFMHYSDAANIRRNQEIAHEKIVHNNNLDALMPNMNMTLQQYKDIMKKQKNHMGYEEYFKFTHDFKLKSTALLTAVQVGDIYLVCLPITDENRHFRSINFDTFCHILLLMSLVAFRESSAEPAKKIKALLLFMWRSINSPEKSAKAVNDRYGSVGNVEGHAGSLNLYGSGQFSDMFLDMWQSEGFSNYVTEDNAHDDHDEILMKITEKHGTISNVNDLLTGFSEYESKQYDTADQDLVENNASEISTPKRSNKKNGGGGHRLPPPGSTLYGYQLQKLFLKKPEIAELIYLELCNYEQNVPESK